MIPDLLPASTARKTETTERNQQIGFGGLRICWLDATKWL